MSNQVIPYFNYYSGAQVSVFINDIWVDDTASYSIQAQENKVPIFGYGSQHYDLVAKGIVSISGTLTINFKEPNYLWIILANRLVKDPKYIEQTKLQDLLKRFAGSTVLEDHQTDYMSLSTTDQLSKIADFYKDKYWPKTSRSGSQTKLDPEHFNHLPCDMYFQYGDRSTGVIEKLTGVEFVGRAKIVESSGQPIQEVYNFVARTCG